MWWWWAWGYSKRPQQALYFLPEPQGHGSFRPIFGCWRRTVTGGAGRAGACALLVWGGGAAGGLTAVGAVDGKTVEEVPLSGVEREERTFTGNGYTLHVALTAEGVWVERSDCPTQDCVHTGHISRSGQSIVCLPARVVIQLEGGTDSGVDAVIG